LRFRPERRLAALLILAAAALAGVACSSVVSESDDPWTASYVDDAERVWAAIHRALDALGYEVEEEDRGDGTIRAAQINEPSYRSVVLRIEEVQKAELVRVIVRPSAGATGTPDDHRRRDEAVREFLTALDEHLGRRPAR
jgi:uncharacterized lipoprotein